MLNDAAKADKLRGAVVKQTQVIDAKIEGGHSNATAPARKVEDPFSARDSRSRIWNRRR
jgi:hypothetical protein